MIIMGNKLKKLRNGKRLTQKQLGDMIGISISSISNYETGLRRPSYEVLIRYSQIFHVTTDYILGIKKPDFTNLSALDLRAKEILFQIIDLLRDNN